ncbi:hypothetical protein CYY_007209 [Polysphondylium violaceum]|uniref:ELMO domain-containing protein n=1 Tax=Polysphondylium violaceum TaxID=133409 RepID=A0A8J4UXU0_9MYCE|nr:hypothetical protein CYY_007209 [Polysphondylium violaceum]
MNTIKIHVFKGDIIVEYQLIRGVKVTTQIDILCQIFRIDGDPSKYCLFIKDLNIFITDESLFNDGYEHPLIDNCRAELMLSPNYQVDMILEQLNSEATVKKGLMGLKVHLQNSSFASEFFKKDGLTTLQSIIFELKSGNVLSYALTVLDMVASLPEFKWSSISLKIIDKIVTDFDHQSINIVGPSLKIAIKLANDTQCGYKMLIESIENQKRINNENIYFKLINNNLNSKDINTQAYSLTLINSMVSSSPEPIDFLELLEGYKITNILKTQLHATDIIFRKQIYKFQNLKIQEFIKDSLTNYNKDELNHQKLLERLWLLLFPDEKFHTVDETWKTIGFQSKDPASDFRGMGIAGLKHLLYLATHYKDIFLQLTNAQTAIQQSPLAERYYPVAVCGINITSLLLEIIKPQSTNHHHHSNNSSSNNHNSGSSDTDFPIYPALFDHRHSIEEIYCIVIEVFGMVWDDLNARYMDFQKVLQFVRGIITESLVKSNTLAEFKASTLAKRSEKKINEVGSNNKKNQGRHSKSLNSGSSESLTPSSRISINTHEYGDRKSFDYISRSVDIQREIMSKSFIDDIELESCTISPDGNSPLHSAVLSHSYDNVTHYLNINSYTNSTNNAGLTPLNAACNNCSPQMIELILSYGTVDLSIPSKGGYRPIHNFSSRKWVSEEFSKIIKLLLDKPGSDIDIRTIESQETSLHIAVGRQFEDNVRVLLSLGANPNGFNKKGETPLHIAVAKKNKDIIATLIHFLADPFISNALTNESCIDLCHNDQEIMSLLRQRPLDKSSSSSSSSSVAKIPDEANNLSTIVINKKPTPLPKRPGTGSIGPSGSNLLSVSNGSNSNSISNSNNNNNLNNNTNGSISASSSISNIIGNSLGISNRSISPTPPTSPGLMSPNIKPSTPLRHTNSVIGLSSHYLSTPPDHSSPHTSILSTPTSPQHYSHTPPIRTSSSFFNEINGSYGNLSSIGNCGNSSNGFGRGGSNSSIHSSFRSPTVSGISNQPNASPSNIKKLDLIKKYLNESLCYVDLLYSQDGKSKDHLKKLNECAKQFKSVSKSIKP